MQPSVHMAKISMAQRIDIRKFFEMKWLLGIIDAGRQELPAVKQMPGAKVKVTRTRRLDLMLS